MPTAKSYPIPNEYEIVTNDGSGASTITIGPAVSGKICLVWSYYQNLSATSVQTVKSGSTTIAALHNAATRQQALPVGNPIDHKAVPAYQSQAAGEAITIAYTTSVTYSVTSWVTYVDP